MAQGEANGSFHYNNCLVNAAMIDLEGIMSTIKVSRNISSFMHITHSINLFLDVVFLFRCCFFATKTHQSCPLQSRPILATIRNMGGAGPGIKVVFFSLSSFLNAEKCWAESE